MTVQDVPGELEGLGEGGGDWIGWVGGGAVVVLALAALVVSVMLAIQHVHDFDASKLRYDLSSVLKSIQRIFAVTPLLGHAADPSTNDLSDFFAPGTFP